MFNISNIKYSNSFVAKALCSATLIFGLMGNTAFAQPVDAKQNSATNASNSYSMSERIKDGRNILISGGFKINHSNFSFYDNHKKVATYAHDDTFVYTDFTKFITEHNAVGFYIETNRGLSMGSMHDENKFRFSGGTLRHKYDNKTTMMEISYETLLDGSRADFVKGKFYRGFTTSLGYSETEFAWKQDKVFGYKEQYNYFGVMLSGLYPVFDTANHKAVLGFHIGYKYGFNNTKSTASGKKTAVPHHLRILTMELNKKLYFKNYGHFYIDTALGYQLRHTGQSDDYLPTATSTTPVHTYKEYVRSRYVRINFSYPL